MQKNCKAYQPPWGKLPILRRAILILGGKGNLAMNRPGAKGARMQLQFLTMATPNRYLFLPKKHSRYLKYTDEKF
jgi:hypothetical protein